MYEIFSNAMITAFGWSLGFALGFIFLMFLLLIAGVLMELVNSVKRRNKNDSSNM